MGQCRWDSKRGPQEVPKNWEEVLLELAMGVGENCLLNGRWFRRSRMRALGQRRNKILVGGEVKRA